MTTEEKPTYGPWWITEKPNVLGTFTVFFGQHRVRMVSNQICQADTLAHARLIAAAPELLEALETILLDFTPEHLDAMGISKSGSKAIAAIAKATGGQQRRDE